MHKHVSGGGLVLSSGRRSFRDIAVKIEPLASTSVVSSGGSAAAAPSVASEEPSPSHSPLQVNENAMRKTSFFEKICCILSPEKPDKAPAAAAAVHQLPPPQPARPAGSEFERVFRYFDENGDGKISPSELRSCLRTVGEEVSQEAAEEVVQSSDSDGDGLLGFDDFVRLVGAGEGEKVDGDLREAYAMYEMEGEGGITPKSLSRMLGRLGEERSAEQCQAMIRRFDLNGDGVISFDEFKVMML